MNSGNGSPGCSCAYCASDSRLSVSPRTSSHAGIAAPCALRQRSAASAVCRGYMNSSRKGANIGLRRDSTKLTMVASFENVADADRVCDDSLRTRARSGGASKRSASIRRSSRDRPFRSSYAVSTAAMASRTGSAQPIAQRNLGQQHRQQRIQQAPDGPNDRRRHGQRREQRRRPANPGAIQAVRRLRPANEHFGPQRESRRVTVDGKILVQIHALAQIADAGLPLANGAEVRGGQQPTRQGVFAHLRAGRAQQFVQAVRAEQIEVRAVDMVVCVEAFAGRAAAPPLILDPRESGAIERRRALRAGSQVPHARVIQHRGSEARDRQQQPLRRHQPRAESTATPPPRIAPPTASRALPMRACSRSSCASRASRCAQTLRVLIARRHEAVWHNSRGK